MAKTIALVGTLDTKGEEIKYVKGLIEGRGHKTVVIDGGVLGEPAFAPDFSRGLVAEAGGGDLKELAAARNERKALAVMAAGAAQIAQRLHSEGKLDGIIALGGSMGTSLGLPVMKSLPLGVPKLMVSTVAFTPLITGEQVSPDQVMIQCVVDMWGLDTTTRATLEQAAAAISAMAEAYEGRKVLEKPLVGITTLGTAALRYVWHAKPLLEERGYEVAVFHTVGIGGRAFERLIEEGAIAGALDLSMHELLYELYGGLWNAGPQRLTTAGRRGIPQVIAPGALDFHCWAGTEESLPPRLKGRRTYSHAPGDTDVEMKVEDMLEVAELMARKLNQATGPTVVLIPTRGFSEWDKPGALFHDAERRRAFAEALKRRVEPKVRLIELDVHINDPQFAEQAVAILDELIKAGG